MKAKKPLTKTLTVVRLEVEQRRLLLEFQARTNLDKSFIIRRCLDYALHRFISGQTDFATLKERS
ncbi:MAG: hypothetical protein LBK71_04880 [Verrucomicrobiales bacterium]|jgi:hypothetical protein|nr:hypothetical protein [Verrucomicrobiales bacterium]MDR1304162.1 hypothetical protein [Verrucomicrobiales bacterium]